MEQKQDLDFTFKLKELSSIAIGIQLFEHELIKPDIRQKLHSSFAQKRYVSFFNKVNDEILKCIKSLDIPNALKSDLEDAVLYLGENLRIWFYQVLNRLHLNSSFLDKFFWRRDGTIDELRTFEYWRKDLDISTQEFTPLMGDLFKYACNRNKTFSLGLLTQKDDEELIDIYILIEKKHQMIVHEKSKEKLIKMLRVYFGFSITDQKSAQEVLSFFFNNHYSEAFKFFWNKIDDIEQQDFLIHFATKELCQRKLFYGPIKYEAQKNFELLVFLMGKMTAEQKINAVEKNPITILEAVYCALPFKEIILLRFFNELKSYYTEKDLDILINSKLQNDEIFRSVNSQLKDDKYKSINELLLLKSWKLAPKSVKCTFVKRDREWENICKNSEFAILKLILNDEELSDHREIMLDSIAKAITYYQLEYKNLYCLKNFFKVIKLTQEEKLGVKKKVNVVQEFFIEGNFNLALKLIDVLCDSDVEKIKFKENLNCSEICSDMICRRSYGKGYTNIQRETVTSYIKFNQKYYSSEALLRNWKKFLNWYFPSKEDVINFKKNAVFINEDFLKKYFDVGVKDRALPSKETYENQLEKIFKFWLVNDEKILVLKEKIFNNVDNWCYGAFKIKKDSVNKLKTWASEGMKVENDLSEEKAKKKKKKKQTL